MSDDVQDGATAIASSGAEKVLEMHRAIKSSARETRLKLAVAAAHGSWDTDAKSLNELAHWVETGSWDAPKPEGGA